MRVFTSTAGQYRVIENVFPISFNQLFNFVISPTQISQNFYRAAKSFKFAFHAKKSYYRFVEHFRGLKIAENRAKLAEFWSWRVLLSKEACRSSCSCHKNIFGCKEKLKYQGNSIWNVSVFSITTIHSIRDTINIIKVFFSLKFM